MADFAMNVAGNVVADLLILGVVAVSAYFGRSVIRDLFRVLRYAWRMRRNGIVNFYNSRAEYMTSRKERNLADYMRRAKRRFVYVGFYLAGATERDRIDHAITELLNRDCDVEIAMLDPDAHPEIIAAVERHLAITVGTLRQVLRHAREHFESLRSGLSAAAADRFKLKLHSVPLASSAMLIDEGEPDGRLLIDSKIHGAGRDRSFGIEFRLDQHAGDLAKNFARSFMRIALTAHRADNEPGL